MHFHSFPLKLALLLAGLSPIGAPFSSDILIQVIPANYLIWR